MPLSWGFYCIKNDKNKISIMEKLNKKEQCLKVTESVNFQSDYFTKLTNKILLLFSVSGSVCQCGSDKLHIDIKNKRIECSGCKSGKWLTEH